MVNPPLSLPGLPEYDRVTGRSQHRPIYKILPIKLVSLEKEHFGDF
jgi:hypothetical protein